MITNPGQIHMWKILEKFYYPDEHFSARFKAAFTEAHKNFILNPLTGDEDLKNYYVPLAEGMMKEFITGLNLTEDTQKHLITGHHGCGITTELNHLVSQLTSKHSVLMFSILDIVDVNKPDYKDILVLTGVKIIQALLEYVESDTLAPFLKAYEDILGTKLANLEPSQLRTRLDGECFNIKTQEKTRDSVREKAEKNLAIIINTISFGGQKIKEKTDKPLLVIIDDLDKLNMDEALKIFKEHSMQLVLPECRMILTLPFSLYHLDDFIMFRDYYGECLTIPLLQIYDKDNKENAKAVEIFDKIIQKRMDTDALFDDEVLNDLIIRTGGIVTDLINMVRECCFAMIQKPKGKIEDDVLGKVAKKRRDSLYMRLNAKERSILKKVYLSKSVSSIPTDLLSHFLFKNLILEQKDDIPWFDVHPMLRKALGLDEEPEYADI
ncbi:MAG: hypothetical protein ACT6FF_05235 [Methanosarcinaceae archaeon]